MTDGVPILAKAAMALLTGGLGYWLWRSSNTWKANGEIPAIWNDDGVPVKASDRGFAVFLVWQKFMSVLCWFFCVLCVASIVLSDVLGLF